MSSRFTRRRLPGRPGIASVPALAACVLAIAILAPVVTAKPPAANKPRSSINPVTYGTAVVITGALKNSPNATVVLQQNPYPYAAYVDVTTSTTSATGDFTFSVMPRINSRYRAVTTGVTPQEISGELNQVVNQRVRFKVSDSTPRRGSRVKFSGTVAPASDGSYAEIQKLSSTGAFRTVARVKLVDAGDTSSRFARRIRISRKGVYQVYMPASPSVGAGVSRSRTLRVH